jgi:hypothetical protein
MATSALAAAAAAARRRLLASFRDAGATSSDAAMGMSEPTRRLERKFLARLIEAGVIHETTDGRAWLDEEKLAAYTKARRRKMLSVAAGAAAVAAIGAAIAAAIG